MSLVLCILGEKGYAVLTSLASELGHDAVGPVFIGRDPAIIDDFSEQNKNFCESLGIKYFITNKVSLDNEATYNYVIAAGWRWMIRGVPSQKLIIFHDSLLPKYRGFAPLVNALLNREQEIGVTALFGAEEYDRGDIIGQESLEVEYPTTIQREISRISGVYSKLAWRIAKNIRHLEGMPQDERKATYSLWRDESDYRIDWNHSATDIAHLISCLGFPYLGASSDVGGEIVRIFKAEALEDVKVENRVSGKVIFIENGMPIVVCGTGLLKITDMKDGEGVSLLPWSRMRVRFR